VIVPKAFEHLLQELNNEGRKKVKLLKDRELLITEEAEKLIKELEECDTYFLHSKLTRAREKRKHNKPFLA